jgi:3-oxoacyl-[acyl-carrier protein] reductase
MKSLSGLTAIITGGASGIGKAIAAELGGAGCELAVIDINPENGTKAEQEFSKVVKCKFYRCNVGDIEEIKAVFEKILADYGKADILVNAAGIPVRDYIEDITPESWEKFMNINVRSVFFFSQIFAEAIRESGSCFGRIVNISSVRAEIFDDFHTGYSLSKAAIEALTKAFAVGYAEDGITANAIAPGFVVTEMTDHYNIGDAKIESIMKSLSPIHRNIKTCEIAAAGLFLASRESSAVNGQIIKVDGGGTCSPGMYY